MVIVALVKVESSGLWCVYLFIYLDVRKLLSQHPFNSMALVHSGTHPTSPDASCWRIKWLQSSETHLSVQEVCAVGLHPPTPITFYYVLLLLGLCIFTVRLFILMATTVSSVCTSEEFKFPNPFRTKSEHTTAYYSSPISH